jgi:hypothetical protein
MTLSVRRDERGRLLPGFSGNPGGRPRGIEAVRDLLRPNAPAFVAALVDLLKSENEATRLAAVKEYFDRLVGKPLQSVDSETRTVDIGALYLQAVQQAQPPPNAVVDITPRSDERPTVDSPTTPPTEW